MTSFVVFFTSFALLVNEILLASVFNVIIGSANTILAIVIALMGLSFSGIVVYLNPKFNWGSKFKDGLYCELVFAFVVAQITCTLTILNIPLNHGDFSYSSSLVLNLLKAGVFFLALMPFFFGGLLINIAFSFYVSRISQLYFLNLLGAAFGCCASISLMEWMGAPGAIVFASLPLVFLLLKSAYAKKIGFRYPLFLFCLLLSIEVAGFFTPILGIKKINTLGDVNDPNYRSFLVGKGGIEFEKWSADAWTIVREEKIPQQWENFKGWGLSRNFRGVVPKIKLINFNSRFTTYVTEYDGDLSKISGWLDSDLISLHYLLGKAYPNVLNVGAGGGREVLNALNHNAREITAVDINKATINDLMKGVFRDFSGDLYSQPQVRAIVDEGRSFISRTKEKFNLIDFTIVGGANIEKMELVSADHLFTLDGLRVYLDHLADGGVFSYVMYNLNSDLVADLIGGQRIRELSYAYMPAVKTLAGLRMLFDKELPSVAFRDCVLIAGIHGVVDPKYDLIHIILSNKPFSDRERERFVKQCREMGFVLFYPKDDASSNVYSRIVTEADFNEFAESLPCDIYPPTDDKPFYYSFPRGKRQSDSWSPPGIASALKDPLVFDGIVIGLTCVLFLIGPLVWRVKQRNHSVSIKKIGHLLVYFMCLGCGYMMVEIAVLLKLQLYLGNPSLAISTALFGFLFSSGLGSLSTRQYDLACIHRCIYRIIFFVVLAGFIFYFCWQRVCFKTILLNVYWRSGIAVAAIFPLAFFMGMLFPSGMKIVSKEARRMVPWIWAINGCFSVFGVFLSRVLALHFGFNTVFLLGLAVYVIAGGCILYDQRGGGFSKDLANADS